MSELTDVSVVLPSLDPDEKLHTVIDGLIQYGFRDIILVNDGSKKENLHYFEEAQAQHPEVHVLTHSSNKGKGVALKNAFSWFLENRPNGKGVVTVDGDNQHHPADTLLCVQKMLDTGHVVLGCRDFTQKDVPARSSFGNKTTSLIFRVFCGMTLSDTQTGLRAIPRNALETFLTVKGDRFEYETNMLLAMKDNNIPFDEVKIRTVYIEENKSSHFRVFQDSWKIYKLILAHFFRYTISSLLSAVLDVGCFALLSHIWKNTLTGFALTAVPSIAARIISSLFNFFVNKAMVFRADICTGKAMLRYYMLAIPQMVCQILITHGVFSLFHLETAGLRTLAYTIVMLILFIISFVIQQRWVFSSEKQV